MHLIEFSLLSTQGMRIQTAMTTRTTASSSNDDMHHHNAKLLINERHESNIKLTSDILRTRYVYKRNK
jgi:hypothetical protein